MLSAFKMNYAVNPTNYQQSARNVLRHIMARNDTEIILRISESAQPIIAMSDILIKRTPTRKDYDDNETGSEAIPFRGERSHQEACVELLKSVMDIDVSLPMGYAIFENPFANTDTNKVEMDCVLTPQDLYHYLATVNAIPYFKEETGRWKGIEQQVDGQTTQSTMTFTAKYRYLKMDKENAVAYLKSLSELRGIGSAEDAFVPTIISTTAQVEAKIYVVALPPCIISIIKDSPLYTAPVSKQRLLYLFDCIQAWLQSLTTRWIEMRFNTIPLNANDKMICFQYKIEKMVQGWVRLPTSKVDPREMTTDIPTSQTYQWHLFGEASAPDSSLLQKLQAVISFLYDYDIDMTIDSYTGPMEDYMEKIGNRRNFILPVREVIIPTVIESSMSYRGRGRGGRGGGDFQASRGRGFNTSRGSARGGRGNSHDWQENTRGGTRGGRGYSRGQGAQNDQERSPSSEARKLSIPAPKSQSASDTSSFSGSPRGRGAQTSSTRGRGASSFPAAASSERGGRGATLGSRAMPIRHPGAGRGRASS